MEVTLIRPSTRNGRMLRRRRTGCHRSRQVLLETRAAQDGPALRGPERNRGFEAACRAVRPCLGSYSGSTVGALRLALFAALWVVLEVFVVKKQLFARSEDEFR